MERVCFESRNCSVAKTMDVIGDWWSILIVLEAMRGIAHFDQFQSNLDISKGILSKRLKSLQEHGVLVKVESEQKERRVEYRLTPKGISLRTVMIALLQWGDEWMNCESGAPVVLYNAKNGAELARLALLDKLGETVEPDDLRLRAGPGADAHTCARFTDGASLGQLKSSASI
jgi:DNA-binding HxlR family transcriptional regulator